jgi:hypothetical protein
MLNDPAGTRSIGMPFSSVIWFGRGVGDGIWVGSGVGVWLGMAVSVGGNWVGVSVAFGVADATRVLVGVSNSRVCTGFGDVSTCWGLQEINKMSMNGKIMMRFLVRSLSTNRDYIAEALDYGMFLKNPNRTFLMSGNTRILTGITGFTGY